MGPPANKSANVSHLQTPNGERPNPLTCEGLRLLLAFRAWPSSWSKPSFLLLVSKRLQQLPSSKNVQNFVKVARTKLKLESVGWDSNELQHCSKAGKNGELEIVKLGSSKRCGEASCERVLQVISRISYQPYGVFPACALEPFVMSSLAVFT